MSARLILALLRVAGALRGLTLNHHLTTDPACKRYRAPYPGSRLDRASRGHSCAPCERAQHLAWLDRAIGREWNQR